MEIVSDIRCFNGRQIRFRHHSQVLDCHMHASIFLPPQAATGAVPQLMWLSGLTCNDENFVQKAGAQRRAAELGLALVTPDTSPRGQDIADDPEGAWDFGQGAGFYVDATRAPWSAHYSMYSYCLDELPTLVNSHFPVHADRTSVSGHSMGGHGALTLALRNPQRYRSVSAFAPITSPMRCPWGEKALRHYLGEDRQAWRRYDTTALIEDSEDDAAKLPMLVDQGEADPFLAEQLRPELLEAACRQRHYPLTLRRHPGYDHSYFFIATFIEDHLRHHADVLLG